MKKNGPEEVPGSIPYESQATHSSGDMKNMISGWWFGTFFIFPYIGNNNPNWLSYFSEGLKPPTSYEDLFIYHMVLYITSFLTANWRYEESFCLF